MTRRRQRGYPRLRKTRLARFEHLEPRHLLSAASNLAITTNAGVQQTPSVAVDQLSQAAGISNQAITTDAGVQQMPSVAVDPLDSNHVVIACMDYSLVKTGYAGIGVATSHDGGDNWQYSSVPLPAGFDQGAANPTVKFDNVDHDPNQAGVQNRVYVSFMAATFEAGKPPLTNPNGADVGGVQFRAYGFTADNGIFVSRSDDGGTNWQAPTTVASHEYQGTKVPFDIIPDIAIDTYHTITTDGQQYNPMYATFSRYYPAGLYPGEPDAIGGSNIIFAVSRDGGQTWQEKTESHPEEGTDHATVIFNAGIIFTGRGAPEGLGLENWAHVTVGPEGDIYVSQSAGGRFAIHHSTDGGETFSHPDLNELHSTLSPFGVNSQINPPPFLSNNPFRLQNVRAIVADPTRPGTVYVAEADTVKDKNGAFSDEADLIFNRSTNSGDNWDSTFHIGQTNFASFVNDDNGGNLATGSNDDVVSFQTMPRMVASADGTLALIWYDTRRDPANHLMDVFASVSTDGGKTFSPNFRVTDNSFDADAGKFTDARGRDDYYLGDTIGMALAGDTMYAAWTDTRPLKDSNNQDIPANQNIFFSRVALNPIPKPLNDRFEPNDSPDAAVQIGPDPVFRSFLPQLTLATGEDDWFKITPPTGQLTVTAQSTGSLANLQLEVRDAAGTNVLASGGRSLTTRVTPGQSYLVRVHSTADAGAVSGDIKYSLELATVTEVLGEVVHDIKDGALQDGNQAYYLVQSKVAGSITAALTVPDGFQGTPTVELSDLRSPNQVLSTSSPGAAPASVPVLAGQQLLVRVAGGDNANGAFRLELSNLDQFNTELLNQTSLFFATGGGPSEAAVGDLNGDGAPDIVVSHVGQNIISVLLNNGDGTFQAPREFPIGAFQQAGPFTLSGLSNFHRDLAIANVNPDEDDIPDLIVVNTSSGDVSVLLGNGDGTFRPQRRFDATAAPFAMAVGFINDDQIPDIVVIDSSSDSTAHGAVLLGRGDGTFRAPLFFELPNREVNRTNAIRLADVNGDHINDLIERDYVNGTSVLLGRGDGTFGPGINIQGENGPGLTVADLNNDGNLDVVTTRTNAGQVRYSLNRGDGSFVTSQTANVGQFPVSVAVADFGSAVRMADNSFVLGPADGHPDLIVSDNGQTLATASGPPEIVLLPGLVDDHGNFAGFGDPIRLASAKGPLDVKVENVNPQDDQTLDIVVVDRDGVFVIYGKQPVIAPNDTQAAARDLGTVVHLVEPTLTIVPDHANDFYKLVVPNEVFAGAGDQVLDFSGGFTNEVGPGLMMEVLDANGNVRGSGKRFRVRTKQGEELFVHVFAAGEGGAGAYALVINTLPQVAAVEAHSLFSGKGNQPAGPITNLVLVFQGDRLDPTTAESPENYTVTWLGRDGVKDGGDDQTIAVGVGLPAGSQSVIYDPSRNNVDFASGRTIPTAVRQTVTLLFGEPLPVGNYEIVVGPDVISARFNDDEIDLLSAQTGFSAHPVVSLDGSTIDEGARLTVTNLVHQSRAPVDLSEFERGNSFLTQFHNDLGAFLDALLTLTGDQENQSKSNTQELLDQIIVRFGPTWSVFGVSVIDSLAIIPIDPTSVGVVDPGGHSLTYDLQTNLVAGKLPGAFVEVGGNVEVLVIPNPGGHYQLNLADVPAGARGGVVYFSNQQTVVRSFTDALRGGTLNFVLNAGSFNLTANLVTSVTASSIALSLLGVQQFVTTTVPHIPAIVGLSPDHSSFSAVNLLLNSLTRPSSFLSPAAVALETGSGSAPRGWLGSWDEVWHEVFKTWNEVDDNSLDTSPSVDGNVGKESYERSPMQRVWDKFKDAVDAMLEPAANPTPRAAGQQPARQNADQTESPQNEVQSKSASGDAEGGAPISEGTAPTDGHASSTSAPETSSTDAKAREEDPAHATAA